MPGALATTGFLVTTGFFVAVGFGFFDTTGFLVTTGRLASVTGACACIASTWLRSCASETPPVPRSSLIAARIAEATREAMPGFSATPSCAPLEPASMGRLASIRFELAGAVALGMAAIDARLGFSPEMVM